MDSPTSIIIKIKYMGIFVQGKMPNHPERPIPPKVLGFENSQILDLHLKPQSSPSVLKLNS